MRNELQRHKKSDKIKWIAVFAAVILLAVSVTAAITKGFKDWNPYGWFDKKEEQNIPESAAISNTSIQMEMPSLRATPMGEFESTFDVEVPLIHAVTGVDNGLISVHVYTYGSFGNIDGTKVKIDVSNYQNVTSWIVKFINGAEDYVFDSRLVSVNEYEFVNYIPIYDVAVYESDEALLKTIFKESLKVYFEDIPTQPLPPNPVKEGYTFKGWFTDEQCTVAYEKDYITSDITLYAGWEINRHTITFDVSGGSLVESVTADWNTVPELPVPVHKGYDFKGWLLPSGVVYDETTPLKSDLTLIAKWEIQMFTVTFIVDGETYHTLSVPYGTKLTDAIAEARLKLNVKSVVQNDGSPIDTNMDKLSVTADMTAEADIQTTAQKVVTSWWKLLIGAVLGIGLLAFICCIPSMIKGGKKRRYRV